MATEMKTKEAAALAGTHPVFRNSFVRLEDDDMTAWLYLDPPIPPKTTYTNDEITNFLVANGVVKGFHTSNIAAISKKKIFCREIRVARGQMPRDGQDGYYDYLFSPDSLKAPAIRPDGSVDYTSMSMLQNVRAGDTLAIYHHSEKGKDGFNLKGHILPAKIGRDLPPLRGKNISNQENPDVYIANIDGKIECKDGRMDIQSVHEIMGDVDLIIGKIEFFGDVIINGSVEAGVTIRAGRNIIIKGSVEAVNMFAGGDIILERGIQGGQKAKLVSKGNVFADFIEHTTVEAQGDVQANIIMNSQISSQGKVILTGKKGSLIGGTTHALMGIEATNLGNKAEVKTIVHVGYKVETYDAYIKTLRREQDLEDEMNEIVVELSGLVSIRKRGGRLSKMQLDRIEELSTKQKEIVKRIAELKQEKENINAIMLQSRGALITIDGPVNRGCVICVDDAQMLIERSTCYMKYGCRNGIVESTVIIK